MIKNLAGQAVICGVTNLDGTPKTDGTVAVYITGNQAAQALGSVGSGLATHVGNGDWRYLPSQAETNYDEVKYTFIRVTGTEANNQGRSFSPLIAALTSVEVQALAAAALAAYDPPTNAEMVARTIVAADYSTAANLAVIDAIVDLIVAKTNLLTFTGTYVRSDMRSVGGGAALVKNATTGEYEEPV